MNTGATRSVVSAVSLVGLLIMGIGSGSHAGRRAPSSAVAPSAGSVPPPGPATSLGKSSSTATSGDVSAQYIVNFKNERGLNNAVFHEMLAGTALSDIWTHALDGFVATLSPADVQRLKSNPDVVSVQPDKVIQTSVDQISPPWGLDRIDQQTLPLNGGYSYASSGLGVTAYILDSGINTSHIDFSGRIARGSYVDFTPLNPIPPNPFLPLETASFEDCNGHGTHVAGIVGGTTYGLAKDVSLVPVKVFRCNGSSTVSDVINGLDFVIADHAAHPGPAVANLSFGGTVSPALDAAVASAIASGITVVVAAGNDNADACLSSPADLTAAITVAASDILDNAAPFTNHGPCVDVFAPGVGILSAWIDSPTAANVQSGTSMAAPHVAGVVARMLELTPTATPDAIWTALSTASTAGALTVPVGDPNLLAFIAPPTIPSPAFAPTPPMAPRSVFARPLVGSTSLSWLPPFSDGRSAITGYTTSCSAVGQPTVTDALPVAVSPWLVSGLVNGVQYSCSVSAENAMGVGPLSPTKTVTPRTTPGAPDSTSVTPASRKALLTWTPPTDNGGAAIKGYVASCSDGLTPTIRKVPATKSTVSVSGLTNGTAYSCTVAARNVAGLGLVSVTLDVTPRTIPSAPLAASIVAGPASATITFFVPLTDGGAAITSYSARCVSTVAGAISPVSSTGGGSPMLIPGLSPGLRYLCNVVATNAAGNSRPTTAKSVTPTA